MYRPHHVLRLFVLVGALLLSVGWAQVKAGGVAPPPPLATWHVLISTHASPLFYRASGITVGGQGNIILADVGSHRISKFFPSGSQFGSLGTDTPGPLRF